MKSLPLLILLLLSLKTVYSQEGIDTYIKAGKLFDSENKKVLTDYIIKITGNEIVDISRTIEIPKKAHTIDLSGYTVLPGLIDSHTHLLHLESLTDEHSIANEIIFESDGLRILRASKRARSFLENGITTVRDLGNSGQYLDVALKQAIEEGSVDGPRMIVSGPILSSVGGQIVGLKMEHTGLSEKEYTIIHSVDQAIEAVREHVYHGVDIIKICANNTPNNTTLTLDEMTAIVKMAHRYKMKVIAHATNDQAIWEATKAGVDGIEHGYKVSDSTLAFMASKNVRLTPTDLSIDLLIKYYHLLGEKEGVQKSARDWQKSFQQDRLRRALEKNITILMGSDSYIDFEMPQGKVAKNTMIALYEEGMPIMDILQSATYNPAYFMGMENKIGVLKKGAYADIIAIKGDIQEKFPEKILNIDFVMKNGKIYTAKE